MITSNIIRPISVNAVKGIKKKEDSPIPEPVITDALLMEDGKLFLMENGSYFRLEGSTQNSFWKF